MRALMILEESSTQRMLEEYFESRGFRVTVCSDAGVALEVSQREHYQLILLDRLLGGTDGRELCRNLRRSPRSARSVILVMTVSNHTDDIQLLIKAGADDYLVLPMEPEQLFARLYLAEQRTKLMSKLFHRGEAPQPGDHDLQVIADSSPVMLWVSGEDGLCTFFNRSYLEYTGRTLTEECGMGWTEHLHPDDYSRCLDTHLGAAKRREEFRVEYRLRSADGSYRWILSSGVPRHTQYGEFTGHIGSCVDISEHKRSESILRSSEERLRLVVKTMPVMMVAFDERCRVLVWNRECERVTGYTADEVIRNPDVMSLLAPQHGDRDQLLERWARPHAAYRDWEMEVFCRDGEPRNLSWSNISDELRIPGWASWGIGVDITERKRAEMEHRRLQSQMLKTEKLESLGHLAGGVAHDFNNLLVSILGKANLVRREIPEGSTAYELIEQVEHAAKMAADLTNQMLAYSGKGKFIVQPLSLSEVVANMQHLLQVAVRKEVEVIYELDSEAALVEGDVTQIQQVAMNLVSNACEAIDQASGYVKVQTGRLYADRTFLSETYLDEKYPEGYYSYLSVTDNGCGMDADRTSQMFDPFFTTKFTGRGLGLAAVIGIVRGHRGALKVDSECGEGTTVTVLFPCLDQQPRAPGQAMPDRIDLDYRGDGTFLVVDDEEAVRSVAQRMLEEHGFRVLTAEDGKHALETYRTRHAEIDAVLLDLTMPQMNGEEAMREIQRIRPDVPVILSSGYSEHDIVGRFLGGGPAGFIQKPYTADGLIEKVREVLSR